MRIALLLFIVSIQCVALPWGFEPHRQINVHAVFLLPPPLYSLYRTNIEAIRTLATKADQRRYIVKEEGAKHYIDLDHYESLPLDSIRLSWDSAVVQFSEDSLRNHGILPWNLQWTFGRLVNAFKEGDLVSIIKVSADLGHYIADAHVPLHTTSNYNGQATDQHGIHGLWETRLPALFSADYDLLLPDAIEIKNIDSLIWITIEESHALTDVVLDYERRTSAHFLSKYGFEGGKKVYHKAFCTAYNEAMEGMVERRMKNAIYRLSCLWYTAWVRGGRPVLLTDLQFPISVKDSAAVPISCSLRDSLH